jgi:hypothetical protein
LEIESYYCVELGFSVTFHKIQGKTMDKIVLQINFRAFTPTLTFNQLYTGLSRVFASENIRLIEKDNISYIDNLKRSEQVNIVLSCYDENNILNCNKLKSDAVKTLLKEHCIGVIITNKLKRKQQKNILNTCTLSSLKSSGKTRSAKLDGELFIFVFYL